MSSSQGDPGQHSLTRGARTLLTSQDWNSPQSKPKPARWPWKEIKDLAATLPPRAGPWSLVQCSPGQPVAEENSWKRCRSEVKSSSLPYGQIEKGPYTIKFIAARHEAPMPCPRRWGPWGSTRPSARSYTWVGVIPAINTGWGMKGSRAALLRGTWGYW